MHTANVSATPNEFPLHRENDVAARLQQSEIFRDYQQAFQTATGLPLTPNGGDVNVTFSASGIFKV